MPTVYFERPTTTTTRERRNAPDAAARVRALQQRRRQLELRLERCRARSAGASDALRPSLGRDMDDARAALASVLAELARLP